MHFHSFIALITLALAFTFEFVNGFHDTANAVATVIYTKALRAPVAIVMSGICNFLGCLVMGTAVALVITEVIPRHTISLPIILAVLMGSLIWNLYTWYHGIPVSSSHCLIGGLFGAGIASGGVAGVEWGALTRVLLALVLSPFLGFVFGALVTAIVDWLVKVTNKNNDKGQPPFMRWMQVLSSAAVSFTHGSNDGQKTMGVIAMILASQFPMAGFTYGHIPLWVIVATSATIGLGTTIGGWRVIRTVGTKISRERLRYTHGFSAELTTAGLILTASLVGAPISTTHTLTSAVAGGTIPLYGKEKLNMETLKLIVSAWVLTVPVSAALAAISVWLLHLAHLS
jgi:inorganic phosphate transporter, PiT family